MAQTKHEIQSALAEAGTEPRYRFGQNFMIDGNLVRLVADAGMLSKDDTAIEIGPGTGTLTEELLARAGRVVAVEIDRDLAGFLREKFAGEPRFSLIEGDALAGKHSLNPSLQEIIGSHCKLVANLPYNIASPLVIDLLIAGVSTLTFTVQKEVAERLRAKAGEEAYGPLSVIAQMLSQVEILRTLPPQAFWPAPKIDSALVRMLRKDRLEGPAAQFSTFLHQVFSFRRKTLRKSLTQSGFDAAIMLEQVNLTGVTSKGVNLKGVSLDGQQRPETATPEQMFQLFLARVATAE